MGRQKPYWYYPLKFSWLGRIYTRLRHPAIAIQMEQSQKYYRQVLPESEGIVFDIGANVGDLSAAFLAMGYSVVACEPDPANFKVLEARFTGNDNITVLQKAVASQKGIGSLFSAEAHGGSLTTLSKKRKALLDGVADSEGVIHFDRPVQVDTITLDDLITRYGRPVFIKIDVEGYEHEVLAGLTSTVPLLSFEANLPEFVHETRQCLQYLHGLNPQALFNASADDAGFLLNGFQSLEIFSDWFEKQEYKYLEVFCRMEVIGGKTRV